MKKLLTLTAVGAMLAAPAMAAQKCVQLPTKGSDCSFSRSSFSIEIPISCSAAGISMKAIALCASAYADKGGTVSAGLVANTIDGEAMSYGPYYCWCKLVQPVESRWVLASSTSNDDFDSCSYLCSQKCAEAMWAPKDVELDIWPIMLENLLVD